MRTFVFKAYASRRNRKLHHQIDIAASIWNHCIALHKRYFRLFGKHLNQFQLMKHITKLKRLPRYFFWSEVGSQSIQDVVQRIEKGYQLFFTYAKGRKAGLPSSRKVRPPTFQKRIKRDINAAINIQRAGASALGLGDVRPGSNPAVAV